MMYVLNVEKRDGAVRAKKLKKEGLVPGSIYGGDLQETLLIQMSEKDAKKLLKTKKKGGIVTVNCAGDLHNVLLKEFTYNGMKSQVDDISFQKLIETESVNGTAQVVLKNREKIPHLVQQMIDSISYKALPTNLIEEIEIDLSGMQAGDAQNVADLLISKDPNVDVLTPGDQLVFNIVDISKGTKTEE